MTNSIDRLMHIADMMRGSELSKLAALRSEITALETRIAELRVATASSGLEYQRAGGERIWNIWRDRQIAALNRDLAMLRAREPYCRQQAARAIARTEVLGKITPRRD